MTLYFQILNSPPLFVMSWFFFTKTIYTGRHKDDPQSSNVPYRVMHIIIFLLIWTLSIHIHIEILFRNRKSPIRFKCSLDLCYMKDFWQTLVSLQVEPNTPCLLQLVLNTEEILAHVLHQYCLYATHVCIRLVPYKKTT